MGVGMTNFVCVFCEKDLQNEKFRVHYQLLPWADDPADPESLNKVARATHDKCFRRFLELNFDEVKYKLLDMISESEERKKHGNNRRDD
jgi:hypothetical protein